MAQNVRFYLGTREQYNNIAEKNPLALYFCEDTAELFRGDQCLSDALRIVPTRADLPECSCAADGIVYFIAETKSGFMVSPDRTEWLQTIYAPVTDAYSIPEEEMYTTVTTVGAVRDIEAKIYKRIEEIATGGLSTLTPIDGTIKIADAEDGGKSIGVQVSQAANNLIAVNSDGLFATVDLQPIEQRLAAVETNIVGGVHYKGSVPTVEDLPTDAAQGDLYEVEADGSEYCYNGEKWFVYGTSHFVPVAGDGISVNGNEISVKIATDSHGLQFVDGSMSMLLVTKDSDGAMSKEDKRILDAIPYVYETRKYEIADAPVGTLVNYREDEIRIMCPADATYTKQSVGAGGDVNTYYVTLKTYAPSNDAVGYIEYLNGQSDAEILTDIKIDQYGRRYQPTWLGVAKFDEATGIWTYYGASSSTDKMIGWDYRIDWYNNDGVKIYTDSIRINLSNEDCHNRVASASVQAVTTELETVKESVAQMEQAYSWSEM